MSDDLFKTLQTIKFFSNYNRWLYDQMRPFLKGTVVDVGSGIGNVAYFFEDNAAIEKTVLTDASVTMLSGLHQRFDGKERFEIIPYDISSSPPENLRHMADVVTCVNVLEHIEDDRKALRHMAEILKPGGSLILMVPSLMAIYGSLDKLVGHYRRYTKPMISRVVDADIYSIEEVKYMNMLGVLTWFFSGKILRMNEFHPEACGTLDKLVPLLKKVESGFTPAFGQSLIAVCRKTDSTSG